MRPVGETTAYWNQTLSATTKDEGRRTKDEGRRTKDEGRRTMGGPYSCWVHSVRAWTDMDSDPVCFDIKSGTNSKDDRIVKIDHGEILCNYRVKVGREI